MSIQLITFAVAVVLTIVFTVKALNNPIPPKDKNMYVLDKAGYDSTMSTKKADTIFVINPQKKSH